MIERSEDHRYRRVTESLNPDDPPRYSEWVPGVTSITGLMPKGGLVQWAANAVAAKATSVDGGDYETLDDWYNDLRAEPDRIRDKASSLGTRVHHYAEHKLAGQEPIFADDVEPYAQQYIKGFLDKYAPTPIAREFYVWGGDYGGTADLYAGIGGSVCTGDHGPSLNALDEAYRLAGPHRWLIDYKTSTKRITTAKSGFPYPETALQLAGLGYADIWQIDGEEHVIGSYREDSDNRVWLEKPGNDYPIDHYGVLAITPEDCQLIEYDVTEDEWYAFRALHGVKSWIDSRKGQVKR